MKPKQRKSSPGSRRSFAFGTTRPCMSDGARPTSVLTMASGPLTTIYREFFGSVTIHACNASPARGRRWSRRSLD